MEQTFNNIRKNRINFQNLISALSIDQLNRVPNGFNNNIIWNFGHIVASQQILCYEFTNNSVLCEDLLISKYRQGTKPETIVDQNEIDKLIGYLITTIDRTEKDYNDGVLKKCNYRRLRSGIELLNIEDAVKWAAVHDGMHLGYAMAIRRMIL